jgi:CxxC motif-containing protein (DUF1111 family)
MRPTLLLVLCLTAPAALAQEGLGDPHLAVVPRTAEEAAKVAAVLAAPEGFAAAQAFEGLPGGAATVPARADVEAFSQPSANIDAERKMDFTLGNAIFSKLWVAAPASTRASDGLGPLYNARACGDCHPKDGRGHAPEGPEDSRVSMVARLSVPGGPDPEGIAEWLATSPHPVLGGQLQDFAAPGMTAEGRLEISYVEQPVTLADGLVAMLRKPTHAISGAEAGQVMLSPRVAPQMIGLGLLEAIPAGDILALADPEDADGDGISGRAQIVPSLEHGVPMLGRFGWKAGMPTLREQVADAFAVDLGLSTPLRPAHWGDCTEAQTDCRAGPSRRGRGGRRDAGHGGPLQPESGRARAAGRG